MNSSSEDGQQVFQITFRTHKDIHSIHKHKDIHSIHHTTSKDQPLDQLLVQQLAQQTFCHSKHMDIHNIQHDHKHKDNIPRITSRDQLWDQPLVQVLAQQKLQQ